MTLRFFNQALILGLLMLSGCGFYLRGSEFNGVDAPSRWVKIISPRGFSAELLQSYRDLFRGVENLTLETESLAAIAPLPEINAAAPSSLPSVAALSLAAAKQSHHWRLNLVNEKLETNSNITDSTTINQQVRLTYRLTYRLSTPDGTLWQEGALEHRAEVNFSEAERLSSENKVAQAKRQLILEMARHLLQISLAARPNVPLSAAAPQ